MVENGDFEHPRLVAIETTSRCNAKCSFCPNSALVRDKKDMSDELFEKIVEDCRSFPLEAIEPFLNGEPFVDEAIIPRLEHIRSRLPKTKLRLYTNGSAMTPRRIDGLVGLGIDHLFVSLNTVDPETYRSVMGLRLERTLDNLSYLTHPMRIKKVAKKITVRMTRSSETTLSDQRAFLDLCRDLGVRPFIAALYNYKGSVDSALPVPNFPCEHITRLDVLSSGLVTLCCMDHDGEYTWGDLNSQSVLEAHNSSAARRYRNMLRTGRRREIVPCNVCNLFWPSLKSMPAVTTARFALEAAHYFVKYRPVGMRAPSHRT